jgi:hypothetical protein
MESAFVYMLWATILVGNLIFLFKFLLERPKQPLHDVFPHSYHRRWRKFGLTQTHKVFQPNEPR